LSGVVSGTEFVTAGIGFARLGVGRFGGIDAVADFFDEDGRVFDLEVEASRVLIVGVAIAGENRGLDVESAPGNDANFRGGSGGRIEGFEGGGEKIAEGVVQRLDDVGGAVFLIAVEVQAGELPCAEEESIVKERLLEPEGIEARSMSANETAGIGDHAHVSAKIDAILPEAGDVESETVPASEFAEIDIHRAADAAPTGVVLS